MDSSEETIVDLLSTDIVNDFCNYYDDLNEHLIVSDIYDNILKAQNKKKNLTTFIESVLFNKDLLKLYVNENYIEDILSNALNVQFYKTYKKNYKIYLDFINDDIINIKEICDNSSFINGIFNEIMSDIYDILLDFKLYEK